MTKIQKILCIGFVVVIILLLIITYADFMAPYFIAFIILSVILGWMTGGSWKFWKTVIIIISILTIFGALAFLWFYLVVGSFASSLVRISRSAFIIYLG